MKTTKRMRICKVVIPAGTTLQFSNEGLCFYKGLVLSKRAMLGLEADMIEGENPVKAEAAVKVEDDVVNIKVDSSFFSEHSQGWQNQGLVIKDYCRNYEGKMIARFQMPKTRQEAYKLVTVMAQCGNSMQTIIMQWPKVAVLAGLIDNTKFERLEYYVNAANQSIANSGQIRPDTTSLL